MKNIVLLMFVVVSLLSFKTNDSQHNFQEASILEQYHRCIEKGRTQLNLFQFLLLTAEEKSNYFQANYYVTVSGKSTNNGLSEDSAWNIKHAVAKAPIGATINVKAGNYGNKKLTVRTSGITIKGYTKRAGDVKIQKWSTYGKNHKPSSAKMPFFKGNDSGDAWFILAPNVTLENILIQHYKAGVRLHYDAEYFKGRNIDIRECGKGNEGPNDNRSKGDTYDGFGFLLYADNPSLYGCTVIDSSAESYNSKGSDNGHLQYCRSIGTANSNPVDYHFLLGSNNQYKFYSENWLIEDCYAESAVNSYHKGHGFDCKDIAKKNTFRRCHVKDTQFEVNFAGVENNLFEDCIIESSAQSNHGAKILVSNGAKNNVFRNFYTFNTQAVISLKDHNDGYVGYGKDRDLARVGDNNIFENFVVKSSKHIISWSYGGGGTPEAIADGFILKNWTINELTANFNASSFPKTNWQMINIGINSSKNFHNDDFHNLRVMNCSYNGGSGYPSGWLNLGKANFVKEGGNRAKDFQLKANSPWINKGSDQGTKLDFDGKKTNGRRDIGAFEFQNQTDDDFKAPEVKDVKVTAVTDTSFKVDWKLNEKSKGQLRLGTTPGQYTKTTRLENTLLGRHIQSAVSLQSGTKYYWQIYVEDASGNKAWSNVYTTTTTSNEEEQPVAIEAIAAKAPKITNVKVTDITESSFKVDWNLNKKSKGQIRLGRIEGKYIVRTKLEHAFLNRHIQTPGAKNQGFNLQPNTTYYWQIYAEDAAGNGSWSKVYTTKTKGSDNVFIGTRGDSWPPKVTKVKVTEITDTSFKVDWYVSEKSKGQIRLGTSKGRYQITTLLENSYLNRHIQKPGTKNQGFKLQPNTTYYWQIYVEDKAGNKSWSKVYTTKTINRPITKRSNRTN